MEQGFDSRSWFEVTALQEPEVRRWNLWGKGRVYGASLYEDDFHGVVSKAALVDEATFVRCEVQVEDEDGRFAFFQGCQGGCNIPGFPGDLKISQGTQMA